MFKLSLEHIVYYINIKNIVINMGYDAAYFSLWQLIQNVQNLIFSNTINYDDFVK